MCQGFVCPPASERSWGEPSASSPSVGTPWIRKAGGKGTTGSARGPGRTRLSPRFGRDLGVVVACSPPRAQGCPVSVTLSPTCPPAPTVCHRGYHGVLTTPSPGTPAAVPSLCRALPRSAPLPWWALSHTPPAPCPAGTPRSGVCGAPSPGRAPAPLPAPACCPALFPGGKKPMEILLYKKEKKNQTHM